MLCLSFSLDINTTLLGRWRVAGSAVLISQLKKKKRKLLLDVLRGVTNISAVGITLLLCPHAWEFFPIQWKRVLKERRSAQ